MKFCWEKKRWDGGGKRGQEREKGGKGQVP